MLRHNDFFILDIQEQGIEAKDKDILLDIFPVLLIGCKNWLLVD